uniref:Uncharacterized protein n=1 Tax=Anguilla anguilla TaxID=7936 RepID=A0A0E9SP91_ANGAN
MEKYLKVSKLTCPFSILSTSSLHKNNTTEGTYIAFCD